uniref:Putative secreted protein n=1 Tax=Ixodes scapularis TaxID=6945 RepID=A0A4D5RBY7_IXOSC
MRPAGARWLIAVGLATAGPARPLRCGPAGRHAHAVHDAGRPPRTAGALAGHGPPALVQRPAAPRLGPGP